MQEAKPNAKPPPAQFIHPYPAIYQQGLRPLEGE